MPQVIEVNNVSKLYQLGQFSSKTIQEDLSRWWGALRGKSEYVLANDSSPAGNGNLHWALKDISFTVDQGEVIGFIGKNGAGKSTLLKILSRVTSPTTGTVKMHGRIASLLEVGTGFHGDLSGRENIFQNGAILGMQQREIKAKLDEIIAFSGVEKFIDTPVKRYSSGMYVRLAFAVAAHLEPEILIVDEVLAVGDADFQKKCLGKMKEVSSGEGRTVLFVSHNMQAVKNLCNRSVYLVDGTISSIGPTDKVINDYLLRQTKKVSEVAYDMPEHATRQQPGKIKIGAARKMADKKRDHIDVHTPFTFRFEFWNYMDEEQVNLSLVLVDLKGECIFNIGTPAIKVKPGLISGEAAIPSDIMNDGDYFVSIMVVKNKSTPVYYFQEQLHFSVIDERGDVMWYGKWEGAVRPTFIPFKIENQPSVI